MNTGYSTCIICNSQFKSKKDKANKFCSVVCYRSHQRSGAYKTGSNLKHNCSECGSEIIGKSKTTKRDGTKADNIFCNKNCYGKFRDKIKNIVLGNCLNCKKELTRSINKNKDSIYCCKPCKDEHKKSKDRNCITCGVWFSSLKWNSSAQRLVADNTRKTCSHECYIENIKTNQDRKEKISKAFSGSNHPNWNGGSQLMCRGFRGYEWKRIREQAIKRDKYSCVQCGMSRVEHKDKYNCDFNVNHIKPFFQFGGNTELANKLSNLETLCKSCHTKTDWKYRKENQIQLILGF